VVLSAIHTGSSPGRNAYFAADYEETSSGQHQSHTENFQTLAKGGHLLGVVVGRSSIKEPD